MANRNGGTTHVMLFREPSVEEGLFPELLLDGVSQELVEKEGCHLVAHLGDLLDSHAIPGSDRVLGGDGSAGSQRRVECKKCEPAKRPLTTSR